MTNISIQQRLCNLGVSLPYLCILKFLEFIAETSKDTTEKKNVDEILQNFDKIYTQFLGHQTPAETSTNIVMINVSNADSMVFSLGSIIKTPTESTTDSTTAEPVAKKSATPKTASTKGTPCQHEGCTTVPKGGALLCAKHKPKPSIPRGGGTNKKSEKHETSEDECCSDHEEPKSKGKKKSVAEKKVCMYEGCNTCPKNGDYCAKHTKKTKKDTNKSEESDDPTTPPPSAAKPPRKQKKIIIEQTQDINQDSGDEQTQDIGGEQDIRYTSDQEAEKSKRPKEKPKRSKKADKSKESSGDETPPKARKLRRKNIIESDEE